MLLAGTLALAACVETPEGYAPVGTLPDSRMSQTPVQIAPPPPVTPLPAADASPVPATPGTIGAPVALLVPLTGANAERGQALAQAAHLALDTPGSPPLDVRDTASTPEGAAAAAAAALAAGDKLILGPLTAAETAAVAAPARDAGVLVLAFTNDTVQAQPGVWPLGITPVQQIRRLVGAVQAQGKSRFTAVLPPTDFGTAMGTALTQALSAAGAPPPDLHVHDGNNANIASLMRDISGYAERRGPIDARIKAARATHTAAGRKEAAELAKTPIPPPPFDALLLADTGDTLAWEASFLDYYDIDPPAVRLIGPSLWASPAARGPAALTGAWFAGPDPGERGAFDANYKGKFGIAAPALADMAYDAAMIARAMAESGGYTAAELCKPEGYSGVDGLIALQTDGTVRRGLAVFEIQREGPAMIDPAPSSLSAPGI